VSFLRDKNTRTTSVYDNTDICVASCVVKREEQFPLVRQVVAYSTTARQRLLFFYLRITVHCEYTTDVLVSYKSRPQTLNLGKFGAQPNDLSKHPRKCSAVTCWVSRNTAYCMYAISRLNQADSHDSVNEKRTWQCTVRRS